MAGTWLYLTLCKVIATGAINAYNSARAKANGDI